MGGACRACGRDDMHTKYLISLDVLETSQH
jgi:Fe-S cluster biogenesis protein NfuA